MPPGDGEDGILGEGEPWTQLRLEGRRGSLSGGCSSRRNCMCGDRAVCVKGQDTWSSAQGWSAPLRPPQPDASSARLSPSLCSVQGLATIGGCNMGSVPMHSFSFLGELLHLTCVCAACGVFELSGLWARLLSHPAFPTYWKDRERKQLPQSYNRIPSWSVAGAFGGLQLAREGVRRPPWS